MDNLTLAREWQRFAAIDLNSAEYLINMCTFPCSVNSLNARQLNRCLPTKLAPGQRIGRIQLDHEWDAVLFGANGLRF